MAESNDPTSDELDRSRRWFEGYLHRHERGGFDICKVCFWEDDGQDEADAQTVRGGPNGSLSLSEARHNFLKFGVCEARFTNNVCPANPDESPR